MASSELKIPLIGPKGESIDLWRTIYSHGMTSLPPMAVDEEHRSLEITLNMNNAKPRTLRIQESSPGFALIQVSGRALGKRSERSLRAKIRHVLRLDEDLSGFYDLTADDPALSWVASKKAGRMIRAETVFEEVIKTICTTNCAWSATERMISALCEHLGAPAVGAPPSGPRGRAFPSPKAMAEADEDFYRDIVRAGYRSRYLLEIAQAVHQGELDLEALGQNNPKELTDDDLENELLALPGVGPYATAHIMFMLGRYSRLILDSWTRPKYAELIGESEVEDEQIKERFQPYGRYAGLAFWLFLTRDWVEN